MFRSDAPVVVYDKDYWWTDQWDPMDYGREYDFSRPFFEQLKELIRTVPWPSRSVNNLTNSDYCMNAGNLKNCYLAFDADMSENCYYSTGINMSKDSIDCMHLSNSELCYESVVCANCYKTLFSVDCTHSNELYFCRNCTNCSHCLGCINLRNKQYHIFNEPRTKEDYQAELKALMKGGYPAFQRMARRFEEFRLKFPHKYRHDHKTVGATGDYLYNSKNTRNSYMVSNGEDCRYVQLLMTSSSKDCYDYTSWGWNAERIYECCGVGIEVARLRFSTFCFGGSTDLEYALYCIGSHNLFGCVGLRNKEYCILNKQYSKENYFILREKIIAQMKKMPYIDELGRKYSYGEFFPPDLSPFNYNESLAQQFIPLTESEALAKGFGWTKREQKEYEVTIAPDLIPHSIESTSDDVLKEVFGCAHDKTCNHGCTGAFRVVAGELNLYRQLSVPIPHLCPNCRYAERAKNRNPLKLWHRRCQCNGATSEKRQETGNQYRNTTLHFHGSEPCPNEFETSYAPDRPEIVYCEECYNAEVV
jgi:hypothetical protein